MGAAWEAGYRDAVRSQAKHAQLRKVFIPVPARCEQLAKELQAAAAPALTSLIERPEIDALLVFDAGWLGWSALELACRFHKPTLFTEPWLGDLSLLEQIQAAAQEAGVLLMSAFPRRHAPATNRLRELMATKLGNPHSVIADVTWSAVGAEAQLVGMIDLCSAILGRTPSAIAAGQSTDDQRQWHIDISYPPGVVCAQVHWLQGTAAETEESIHVVCEHGSAVIARDDLLTWSTSTAGDREHLTLDRSSIEIIVDQFCRRVVGGLIPVSDLGDLLRSARLTREVWQQISAGC